jgi:predicted membrane protein
VHSTFFSSKQNNPYPVLLFAIALIFDVIMYSFPITDYLSYKLAKSQSVFATFSLALSTVIVCFIILYMLLALVALFYDLKAKKSGGRSGIHEELVNDAESVHTAQDIRIDRSEDYLAGCSTQRDLGEVAQGYSVGIVQYMVCSNN